MKSILVTDYYEDSLSVYSFQEIPMFFAREEYENFYAYLQDNGWLKNDATWSIAPSFDEDMSLRGLIMQQNRDYAYKAVFKVTEAGCYLQFDRILDEEHMIKYEDIYVAA